MNIFGLYVPQAWLLFSAAAIVLSLYALLWVGKLIDRRQKAKELNDKRRELYLELQRIDVLPKLDTTWLIRVPDDLAEQMAGKREGRSRRIWDSRYTHIVVYDEKGDIWFGYMMPSTFQSFADGEYVQRPLYVPLRGSGEMYAGKPVNVDGGLVHVYPLWFSEEETPISEWRRLVELDRASTLAATSQEGDIYQIPKVFYPAEQRQAAEEKGQRLQRLCAEAQLVW